MSIEKCNGSSIVTELNIHKNGTFEVSIAGKLIDVTKFWISKKLKFTDRSLNAFFLCLKTLCLCHGSKLDSADKDIFSTSKKCVKEFFSMGTVSFTVVRHIECLRVVPVTSSSYCCGKCSDFERYKKQFPFLKKRT